MAHHAETVGHYTLYLDESGDHGILQFDQRYPVLALCGIAIEDATYVQAVLPRLDTFKIEQFGHAGVHLHYSAIARRAGEFKKFADQSAAWLFEQSLARLLAETSMTVFCSVIRKDLYLERYGPTRPVDQHLPVDLYLMALDFVLERFVKFLEERWPAQGKVAAESRGRKEDDQVRAEFRELFLRGTQFVSGERFARVLDPELRFASKKDRVAGLELSDICAASLATKTLQPATDRIVWTAVQGKIWVGRGARREGNLGLKCFPRDARLDRIFDKLGR